MASSLDYIGYAIGKATELQEYLPSFKAPEFFIKRDFYETLDRDTYSYARDSFIFCGIMHDACHEIHRQGEAMIERTYVALRLSIRAVEALVDVTTTPSSRQSVDTLDSLRSEFEELKQDFQHNIREKRASQGDLGHFNEITTIQLNYLQRTLETLHKASDAVSHGLVSGSDPSCKSRPLRDALQRLVAAFNCFKGGKNFEVGSETSATRPTIGSRVQIICTPSARYDNMISQESTDVEGPPPPLYDDVCSGDPSNIKYNGANPNVKDKDGFALTQAIRRGNPNAVLKLLERGADPDAEDDYGFALTQAIRRGNPNAVLKLLARGADPDAEDDYGFALTQAIRKSMWDVVARLLDHGANPNVKDDYGSALAQASGRGNPNVMIKLVGLGAK